MKKYYSKIRSMAFSATAKDTYILFVGNLASAFWGFLFTLIAARALSLYEFGVFSAVLNLVVIFSSLADVGIATGAVNFISGSLSKKDEVKAEQYIKAAFVIRTSIVILIFIAVVLLAPMVSKRLLASDDSTMAFWAGALTLFLSPVMLFPFILQAKKKFLASALYDNSFYVARLLFALYYFMSGGLTLSVAYISFGAGFVATVLLGVVFVGTGFIFAKPTKLEYKNLLKFSGWIALNRIVSSVSGRLDIQMLAAMVGAVATGLYSIPSRLASFLIVLAGSYSSVLATRFASFGDKRIERQYLFKSTLALIPIIAGVVLWIIFARPFMIVLFGEKYLPAVPVFQALTAAQIPFLLTVPPVTAIIYAMKKTVYIGALSFFQLAAIFFLNLYLIPRFGILGPTMTFGVTNTLLAIYVWLVVVRYYRKDN